MVNEPSNQEKRHFSRILFDATCALHQKEQQWNAELLDISLKGILINMPDDFKGDKDSPFEVVISLSEDGASIIMSVKLVHQESTHLGFECEFIDLDSITHLKRLVELNLGDHELLNRELNALTTTHIEQ